MTDADLQQAIDKTATLAGASAGESLRSLYREHLAALLKVQATRAAIAQAPAVRPGSIVMCQDNRPGCEKILGGLCDCAKGQL